MNPQKIGRAKHNHTGDGCLRCEHRITMGTTPVCDLFSPPKRIAMDGSTAPKSCPKRKPYYHQIIKK